MTSCCGNELIFNSVISEVFASNLEQIRYLVNFLFNSWSAIGAIVSIGVVVVVAGCKIGIKSTLRPR